jgi:hypothetical protein
MRKAQRSSQVQRPRHGVSDLELSRVDAQLERGRELLVVLSPKRASILIALTH